ncbi:hypothetical protein LEM8419_03547 [Neolewinella maritima]|uniref:Uncharacterized protein n=1 Tax=Neolewinella maritima TaxID=1383882 RepID=A0ABN8F6X7_9BACT|nr:hypothetical protein [Neolewinella maritima]CAH1002675.1 hypothetical protein LEM8419_03547 [Neolewinella maritima]
MACSSCGSKKSSRPSTTSKTYSTQDGKTVTVGGKKVYSIVPAKK